MQQYPKTVTKDTVVDVVSQIVRLRDSDITDRNTFPSVFVSGRSVAKVPASAADVVATDRIGDFNVTATYAYYCVNDGSGNAIWRRSAVSSW